MILEIKTDVKATAKRHQSQPQSNRGPVAKHNTVFSRNPPEDAELDQKLNPPPRPRPPSVDSYVCQTSAGCPGVFKRLDAWPMDFSVASQREQDSSVHPNPPPPPTPLH